MDKDAFKAGDTVWYRERQNSITGQVVEPYTQEEFTEAVLMGYLSLGMAPGPEWLAATFKIIIYNDKVFFPGIPILTA